MGKFFAAPKLPAPPPPPEPPPVPKPRRLPQSDDAEERQRLLRQREAERLRRTGKGGRRNTVLSEALEAKMGSSGRKLGA